MSRIAEDTKLARAAYVPQIRSLKFKEKFSNFLISKYFKLPENVKISLGTLDQIGSIDSTVYLRFLWLDETFLTKLKCLLRRQWKPKKSSLVQYAQRTLMDGIFGSPEEDYGADLYNIIAWHQSRPWEIDKLNEHDLKLIDGLRSLSLLTRSIFRDKIRSDLNLNLFNVAPKLCILANAMIVKIPIHSMQYFLLIEPRYAFNSIRKAQHSNANKVSHIHMRYFVCSKKQHLQYMIIVG